MSIGVWDWVANDLADLSGCSGFRVSVLRPDESIVERTAVAVDDPSRLEVEWHDQDTLLPGLYVGEVSGMDAEGRPFALSRAFKLRIGSELG